MKCVHFMIMNVTAVWGCGLVWAEVECGQHHHHHILDEDTTEKYLGLYIFVTLFFTLFLLLLSFYLFLNFLFYFFIVHWVYSIWVGEMEDRFPCYKTVNTYPIAILPSTFNQQCFYRDRSIRVFFSQLQVICQWHHPDHPYDNCRRSPEFWPTKQLLKDI